MNNCLNEKSTSQTRTTQKPISSLADLENFKINNVVVQMGDDGTNDDISLEVKIYESNMIKFKLCFSGLQFWECTNLL